MEFCNSFPFATFVVLTVDQFVERGDLLSTVRWRHEQVYVLLHIFTRACKKVMTARIQLRVYNVYATPVSQTIIKRVLMTFITQQIAILKN